MEFGKVSVDKLTHIDFSFPPQDPRTWLRLRMNGELRRSIRVGVGCPVWSVKEWLGKVYPTEAKPQDYLYHYSRQFNSIELNTTHYRVPDRETIRRWRESVPFDFKFNPKFPQTVSHGRLLSAQLDDCREFVSRMMALEDKLGVCFLQLPPSFQSDNLPSLKAFLSGLPMDFPVAVEVRHPSFFEEHFLIEPLYDVLAKAGAHTVITDVAGRRDVLHTSLTTTKVLIRFIGNDLHPTDHLRIRQWTEKLHSWLQLGLEQVEFFIHEPNDRNAPDLVSFLTDSLNDECELKLRKWEPQLSGQQLNLFGSTH